MAKRKKRGAARMRQLGLRSVTIWLLPAEYEAVLNYAKKLGVSKADFVRSRAIKATWHQAGENRQPTEDMR